MKFYIKTFGCQMNVNESEIMTGLLENEGHEWTENPKNADVILINTCSVREKAENKMYGAIGSLGKSKKDGKKNVIIGVGGCSAEKEKEKILNKFSTVDFVFGTRNVTDIVDLVERAKKGKRFLDFSDKLDDFTAHLPIRPSSKHHAWITIIHGCNKYCTYCIVPYTRGLEKSRKIDDILTEAKNYSEKGYREITFLGQNVDSYGKDFGDKKPKLHLLIEETSKMDNIERIWFTTSYPTDITDKLIQTVKNVPKAAKYFHLPVQSGSDKILKKMNRKHTRKEYIEMVKKIQSEVPYVTTTSDFIVGFPGETDEDFMQTVDLVKQCRYDKINIAEYSPREGTIAEKYMEDDIPKHIKNKRFQYLMNIQKEINKEENLKYKDHILRVIQESKTKSGKFLGRTINNKVVMFDSTENLKGKFVDVYIERVSAGPLYGRIVKSEIEEDFEKEENYLTEVFGY
ncbi:tRNA (N6-isopentenyl adenosine(37)-C2)-methylthiotransferase MiaB [Geotoga petraea]|uniref:tRNA-2-methylthio-N(6)-dimethylallyladenosine synthase n=1 Tax=Geotoga petraea TaxID=28234 RepID=A0A4Z0W3L9_9BACT|nr:tRNA (N6-isopentenyl adenosine(37)-C2)-methylthiotransferase MiaB [Geotoga petraea]TGG89107.1 tRNA (N6-isopentenyl adenosine(37)-C2)-methylthiotransferase MiaB [Geotoga petraea]